MKYMSLSFLFVFLLSCSHGPIVGDSRLKKEDAPDFLIKNSDPNAKYFKKVLENGDVLYEAKHKKNDKEISITFNHHGQGIESEEDLDFSDIPKAVGEKITDYLKRNYPDFRIIEIEKRNTAGNEFYDIEIRHPSSSSGYWELSFDLDGRYVSREVENYPLPQTHN